MQPSSLRAPLCPLAVPFSPSHAPVKHKPALALYGLSFARRLTLRDSEHMAASLNCLSTGPCSGYPEPHGDLESPRVPIYPTSSTHPGHTSQVLTASLRSSFSVLLTGHEHSGAGGWGGADSFNQCAAEVSVLGFPSSFCDINNLKAEGKIFIYSFREFGPR